MLWITVSGGGDPVDPAVRAHAGLPVGVLLQPMMMAAPRAQVGSAGRAVRERNVVVQIDPGGAADRLGAAPVADQDVLA